MPLNAPLTEDMVRHLANDEAVFQAASELAQSSRLQNLNTSHDGSWLLGEYAGIGPAPYQLSADFLHFDTPVLRGNSPSRQQPDKYNIALMLRYIHRPGEFGEIIPKRELIAKRDKVLAAEERKKGVFTKKGSKNDLDKTAQLRAEVLDTVGRLIADLTASGDWYADPRADQYEKLCKQLNEAHFPALAAQLKRFALVAKDKNLKDTERIPFGASALARLASVYRKTLAFLKYDAKVPTDEDQLLEEYLDLQWSIEDLKARGYTQNDLSLMELSFERLDDEGRALRIEVSNLLDLNSGELHQSIAYRPFKGLTPTTEQPSYSLPILVPEAVLYPGSLNRRIRWEKNSEGTGVPTADAFEAAYAHAIPEFEPVIDEFRSQLRNPFAPTEAVLLMRCAKIGIADKTVVVEDESGGRLEMRDRRKDYSHLFNFKRAAAMMHSESPALLVRLTLAGKQIVAYPLAMLTPRHHLRIGI